MAAGPAAGLRPAIRFHPATMDRYVVIGNPVAHSRSPEIHSRFARAAGEDLVYERLLVEPGDFARAAREFFASGGRGANVTLPFKVDAFEFAHERTPRAAQAGAVNTLALRGAVVLGDNTDGAGLVRDLTANLGLALSGKRILLLGAGGAARGALGPLLELGPRLVVIANRTADRAAELAREFAEQGPVSGCDFAHLEHQHFDLIVNATSASLRGEVPLIPIGVVDSMTTCYDMAYGAGDTAFVAWAKRLGARRAEQGWGMLVEQAAEAFEVWRGIRPDTAPVLRALRSRAATPPRSPA